MTTESALVAAVLLSAIIFVITGGADYGGGMWDLLSMGPRARKQRELIESTMAPIWEAHHVWLLIVLVLTLTGFPRAFAVIFRALHLPLTALVIAVALRGMAFTVRAYGRRANRIQRRWGHLFSTASVMGPLAIGTIVGSISVADGIRLEDDQIASSPGSPWATHALPLITGLFTLALFAHLAAVYLAAESSDRRLKGDFRRRAFVSAVILAGLAMVTFLTAEAEAPRLHQALTQSWWSAGLFLASGLAFILTLLLLHRRRDGWARVCAATMGALIVLGWGLGQFPYLIEGQLTVTNAAAPASTQGFLLLLFGLSAAPALLGLAWLYRIFRRTR